jgi:hypothetical protein
MNSAKVSGFIQQQRALMTKAQRKRTANRKQQYVPFPYATEKSYAVKIRAFTVGFFDSLDRALNRFTELHFDSDSSDIDTLWGQMEEELNRYYGTAVYNSATLGLILKTIAERVLAADSLYFQKQLQIISGVPFSVDAPWWTEVEALWEQENYRLIKSMGTEYITKLNQILLNGITNGYSVDKISDQIRALKDNISVSHANLIARDQIGKLNSLVQKNQMMSIGINTYYWQTAHDERVRGNPYGRYPKSVPSHWIMSDLLCSWMNSGVYSDDLGVTWKDKTDRMEPLQAGMAIQCRCVAAPSWNAYVQNIDKELEGAL